VNEINEVQSPRSLTQTLRVTKRFLLHSGLGLRNGLRIIKALRNWFEIPLFVLGFKPELIVEFRKGPKFVFFPGLFKLEMFLDEPYNRLNVRDRTVVDIGALNGDSAIYFSMRGAKRVIAFEPFPFAAKLAELNVRLNKIHNIEIRNEAIGTREGHIRIDPNHVSDASSAVGSATYGDLVATRTLESIVTGLNLHNAVLKIDCEGCEYDTLSSTRDEILLTFVEIILEYHNGLRDLAKRLTQLGFQVQTLSPKGETITGPARRIGLIHARRGLGSLA
jgi:FkbM family methyltransferase